jgi:hypothetical protein
MENKHFRVKVYKWFFFKKKVYDKVVNINDLNFYLTIKWEIEIYPCYSDWVEYLTNIKKWTIIKRKDWDYIKNYKNI